MPIEVELPVPVVEYGEQRQLASLYDLNNDVAYNLSFVLFATGVATTVQELLEKVGFYTFLSE